MAVSLIASAIFLGIGAIYFRHARFYIFYLAFIFCAIFLGTYFYIYFIDDLFSQILFATFIALFVFLSIIDLYEYKIHLWLLCLFMIYGILLGVASGDILGALALCGIFSIIKIIYEALRQKEVLGNGDILFICGFGSAFGIESSMISIFLGSILAIIFALGRYATYKLYCKDATLNIRLPFLFICLAGFLGNVLYNYFVSLDRII